MRKYLSNNEMAKAFGGYDFRYPDMLAVCKAQRERTIKELKVKLPLQKHPHKPTVRSRENDN